MADWFYIGYCTVMAMFAVAAAYAATFGLRALRRLPRSLLVGFAAAAIVATLTAQKTNNVPPNMNQPQMMQGGGSFQTGFTGFTGLTGLVGIGSIMNLVNPVQTTIDDIMRGWRVESVTTNAAVSYAMPTNAALVGNWHIHGASSSFGSNRIDFGNWAFPLGTNDEAFSSFWYFIDGRIRPAPRDVAHEICAVGVPMSAVPGQSRLWRLEGGDGSRVLTWEDFFLGGDTNSPVNAQIVLSPNGDFLTRSNDVETVCRRVNPDDWDDDGIPNDEDANPTVCDGDFFGPANILPAGANTNAYCTISVVATGPDALVTFAGDKPCNYPDPRFVAKSGVTNEVVILIGKTYAISSDWPFAVVGVSDPETEVWQMRGTGHQTYVCRPVTISASEGNPFTMSVVPLNLGGVFLWPSAQCSCSISGGGDTFAWNCPMGCTCCGCTVEGQYSYEGYWLPATSCLCGCYYDGTGPKWEPSSAPLAASVSASFSKSAVIFEAAYEDEPGRWVGKNSTRTRLNIVANGGPNGGTLSVTSANIGKLSRISGPDLPLASVAVPAETQVSYAIVYEGATASTAADEITVSATVTDADTGAASTNECAATSIRLELTPVWEAPENPCTNRHMYGVGEKVLFKVFPQLSSVILSTVKLDTEDSEGGYELFDGVMTNDASVVRTYTCPISRNYTPPIRVRLGDVEYVPSISLVEPQEVITTGAEWGICITDIFYQGNRKCWPSGSVGAATLVTTNYIGPMTVSFKGVAVSELACYEEDVVTGCFTNGHSRTHTDAVGANKAYPIMDGNMWFVDSAGERWPEQAWSPNSEMVWKIPIGWHRRGASDEMFLVPFSDFELHLNQNSRPLVIASQYCQRFSIDTDGVFKIEKYGHWISRSPSCRVILDGVVLQETHQP